MLVIGNTYTDSPCTPGIVGGLGLVVKRASPVILKSGESLVYFIAEETDTKSLVFGILETDVFF